MSFLSGLGDRCNPLLVREVRQAMRGRGFTGSFVALLMLVVVLTCLMLAVHLEPDHFAGDDGLPGPFGGVLFRAVFGCLELALLGIVPIGAFMAMSEEWNAGTWDQLSLSGLTPAKIVRGRFLAAGVQAMLFASALVPFLAACLLLRGLDLSVMLVGLVWLAVWAPCLTLLAIALGALGASRQIRMLLMALLAVVLFGAGMLMGVFTGELVDRPSWINSDQCQYSLIAFAVAGVVVASYSAASACALLNHPLENRSTAMRLITVLLMVIGASVCAWAYAVQPESGFPYLIAVGGVFALWIPSALFATEGERLSRRVAGHVSPNRLLALLSTPFLPGGGRGFLFLLTVLIPYALVCVAIFACLPSTSTALPRMGYGCLLAACLSVVSFTGLPSAGFSFFKSGGRTRIAAFASIVFVALIGTILQVSFYGNYRQDSRLWSLLNPFALSAFYWETTWDGRAGLEWLFLVMVGVAGTAVALNLPRMSRGIREVLAASKARRES